MTNKIRAAIQASKKRQRALEKKWPSSYSDALETEAARFRDALEETWKQRDAALSMALDSQHASGFRGEWNDRIERILEGGEA